MKKLTKQQKNLSQSNNFEGGREVSQNIDYGFHYHLIVESQPAKATSNQISKNLPISPSMSLKL